MPERKSQNRPVGYARISTVGQTLPRSLTSYARRDAARLYAKKRWAQPDARELLKLLKAIDPSGVMTVTRIDRLARSTFDLFAIVRRIVDAKAQFPSPTERGPIPRPAPGD